MNHIKSQVSNVKLKITLYNSAIKARALLFRIETDADMTEAQE